MEASEVDGEGLVRTVRAVSDKYLASVGRRKVQLWELKLEAPFITLEALKGKLRELIKQGRVYGCACGCRGDFEVVL